jgi:hypothetical protein
MPRNKAAYLISTISLIDDGTSSIHLNGRLNALASVIVLSLISFCIKLCSPKTTNEIVMELQHTDGFIFCVALFSFCCVLDKIR